jgi:nicotinate phosphoribosyltransferase
MTLPTLGIDAYQLTTLLTHADEGRLDHQVSMAFFFRRMPKNRRYVVFSGLRRILEHAAQMSLDESELETLEHHSAIGPALRARPEVVFHLRSLRGFRGAIDAMPEGSVAFAGPASRTDGTPLVIAGAPLSIYTPLLQVRTDLMRAKLLETPWLGFVNHMSMVASKAARVVSAARGKSVMEFGQRRTHPAAALDATWAAWVAGIQSSSNVAAFARWGITTTGTMDHFAVQAAEREGRSRADTERAFFQAYARTFAGTPTTMLVDTYDTERGIRHAVEACPGDTLHAIRIDSNVTVEAMVRARQLLVELGSPSTKIYVSDALDERRVAELRDVVDGFGVGENIVCSPDSATGVGAVAKLVVNGYGATTMKVARGTGKATLPGELQVWRSTDHDLVALASEPSPGNGARPVLVPVWRGDGPVRETSARADLAEARERARREIGALPAALRALDGAGARQPNDALPGAVPAAAPDAARKLVASDALVREIERLVDEAR